MKLLTVRLTQSQYDLIRAAAEAVRPRVSLQAFACQALLRQAQGGAQVEAKREHAQALYSLYRPSHTDK